MAFNYRKFALNDIMQNNIIRYSFLKKPPPQKKGSPLKVIPGSTTDYIMYDIYILYFIFLIYLYSMLFCQYVHTSTEILMNLCVNTVQEGVQGRYL